MDNSNSRSRRLVTYGSTAKPQTRTSSEKPARSSTAKTNSKEIALPSSSRLSRPFYAKLQRAKNGDKQASESAGMTTAQGHAPSTSTTEPSVYDIPSSDDEQTSMARRKRRRYSPDENKTVPLSRRAGKPCDGEAEGGKILPQVGNNVPDVRRPTAKKREADHQKSPMRSTSNPRTPRPARSQTQVSTFNREMAVATDESFGRAESEPKSSPEVDQGHIPKANITPGRRRLIDSLGITETPVERTSESPTSSQPTPKRMLPDRASPGVAANECHAESHIQGSPASVPSTLRGSRVTYARQRSFLDDMISEDLSIDKVPSAPKHRSQSVQRQLNYEATSSARLIVPNEDTNEDGSVRSIHELRQAGGNARYRGAVESIFEDIEDAQNSSAGRCSAFLQLCGKLLDTGLKRRFVECNFDKRLVDCLSMDLQVVPMILAFCAYALGSADGHMSYVLATSAWPKLLDASPILLSMQDEIPVVAKSKASGISRPLQKAIESMVPQLSDTLFPDTTLSKLTPCLLALYCLRSTISTMQSKGNSLSLSTSVLDPLVQTLVRAGQRCVSLETVDPESLQILCMGFSILEASTATTESLAEEHRDILDPLSELHGLLCFESDTVSKIQPLFIRLVLNITNSNPSFCDRFANPKMLGGLVHIVTANFGGLTEDALGQENNSLDKVILALGALTNLTEQSDASRSIFVQSAGATEPFLDQLLQLFMTHVDSISTAHSVVEVHHNVAVGYLAVLLLTLSLDSDIRSTIKNSLAPKGLAVVISTVDEFLQYHQKIEQEVSPSPTQGQPGNGFLSRLQELITRVRLAEQ